MTCVACHQAKVRCDKQVPCTRCARKNQECVPRVSRQGRRPASTSSHGDAKKRPREEAAAISEQISLTPCHKHANHYGVRYLLRSWISFAFTRRSLALLHKAAGLAQTIGLKMDDLLLDIEDGEGRCVQRGMDLLYPILLLPKERQHVLGDEPIAWDEIPGTLKQATACCEKKAPEDRWIWIREMRKGVSRYFLTRAFEQEIATRAEVSDTYRSGERAVIDLFLPSEHQPKHTEALAHQISIHAFPLENPRSTRIADLSLKTKSGPSVVDQISCLCILDLDRAFYFIEYTNPTINNKQGDEAATRSVSSSSSSEQDFSSVGPIDLDAAVLDDPDLDFDFFQLLLQDSSLSGSPYNTLAL